jgi:hypothetical protein
MLNINNIYRYLGEERSVEFEILLLHVVEAIVAVDDQHYDEGNVLEQRPGVDDDSHQGEDEYLDETSDALGQDDQHGVHRRHAQQRCQTVFDEPLVASSLDRINDCRRCVRQAPLRTTYNVAVMSIATMAT